MSLLNAKLVYKPFEYPWAYEAWSMQQKLHWLPEEVRLHGDINDWNNKLTENEKNLLTHIFRFFTQADIEVNNCYMQHYVRIFKPTEIKMMLTAFSNMETIHIAAYSYLLDTIGMPETEYSAFLEYKAMKEKYEYMQHWGGSTKVDIARTLAMFGAFTEGLQLFASFVMLANFSRFNKMKNMGQIITWSIRDETLHARAIIKLYNVFLRENPEINTQEFRDGILKICLDVVQHEDAFIDLAFSMGDVEGLSASQTKQYIRHIADRRLKQLKLEPYFGVTENPLPWFDNLTGGVEHANFFEISPTEYSKVSTQGTWEDVFSELDL